MEPTPANMVDWLGQHFDAGEVEAVVGAGGRLQLVAEHHWGSYAIKIRWGRVPIHIFIKKQLELQPPGLSSLLPHAPLPVGVLRLFLARPVLITQH